MNLVTGFGGITPWDIDYQSYISGGQAVFEAGYQNDLLEQFREVNSRKNYEVQSKNGEKLTERAFKDMIGYGKTYSRAEHYIAIARDIVHKFW